MLPSPQLTLERARADHLAAEASTRQAAAAEREQLASQLDQALRDVAVKQALCDGWQRANQVWLKDKALPCNAAARVHIRLFSRIRSHLHVSL